MTILATVEMAITPVAQAVQIENQDLIGKLDRIKLITEVKMFITSLNYLMSKWNYKGLGMMVHESFMVDKNKGKWKLFPCIPSQRRNFVTGQTDG